eukprot:gene5358-5386_t
MTVSQPVRVVVPPSVSRFPNSLVGTCLPAKGDVIEALDGVVVPSPLSPTSLQQSAAMFNRSSAA